jgi:SAM-dependent methyltransferase
MNQNLRRVLLAVHRLGSVLSSAADRLFLAPDVPLAQRVSHSPWPALLLELANRSGMKVLEVGSREVTGASTLRQQFDNADYVGFDYYPGPNVDVVGDAHTLSKHFARGEFDLVFSSACFEHFAMPWVVAQEMSKVLKVGGHVFVETHFSFASHERPWHFFQFSDMALKVLFPRALGFECIEAGMSNPMVGRFSRLADQDLRYQPIPALYCHSGFLGRKVAQTEFHGWDELDIASLVSDTAYPPPATERFR